MSEYVKALHLKDDGRLEELLHILEKQPLGMIVTEEEKLPVQELRPCKALAWEKGMSYEVVGNFHCWGCDYEEFETGPGNRTIAVIELEDGKIVACAAETVRFLDRKAQE